MNGEGFLGLYERAPVGDDEGAEAAEAAFRRELERMVRLGYEPRHLLYNGMGRTMLDYNAVDTDSFMEALTRM